MHSGHPSHRGHQRCSTWISSYFRPSLDICPYTAITAYTNYKSYPWCQLHHHQLQNLQQHPHRPLLRHLQPRAQEGWLRDDARWNSSGMMEGRVLKLSPVSNMSPLPLPTLSLSPSPSPLLATSAQLKSPPLTSKHYSLQPCYVWHHHLCGWHRRRHCQCCRPHLATFQNHTSITCAASADEHATNLLAESSLPCLSQRLSRYVIPTLYGIPS